MVEPESCGALLSTGGGESAVLVGSVGPPGGAGRIFSGLCHIPAIGEDGSLSKVIRQAICRDEQCVLLLG